MSEILSNEDNRTTFDDSGGEEAELEILSREENRTTLNDSEEKADIATDAGEILSDEENSELLWSPLLSYKRNSTYPDPDGSEGEEAEVATDEGRQLGSSGGEEAEIAKKVVEKQPDHLGSVHDHYQIRHRVVAKKMGNSASELSDEDLELSEIRDTTSLLKKAGDGLYEERSTSSVGSDDEPGAMLLTKAALEKEQHEEETESSLMILIQVMLPFLVAGMGMVGAGLVLDKVQHWNVFTKVTELFIMVPALLGLKGNLEMTLASRLSTHANMGHLDKRSDCISMVVGNLALIQCQAIVVGFLASVAAVVMGWIPEGDFHFLHALLLCASSLVTASFASFILGVIMIGVILGARRCRINPDNVATPIAASLGDLTTLGLLSWISSVLFGAKDTDQWLSPLIIVVFVCSLPLWVWLSSRNKYTKEVLYSGWTPVISAMMISSLGGVILDFTVAQFKGIAVFQPVINGVGGNLVAVQASRISTALHKVAPLGKLPKFDDLICLNPCTAFFSSGGHPRTARVLLFLVIPGHLCFIYAIDYLKAGHTSLTPVFIVVYLLAAMIQVGFLLYLAHVMVHWMWKVSIDPDNSAIPYLTAIGDLLGTGLLAIAFHFLYLIGDRDSDVGD